MSQENILTHQEKRKTTLYWLWLWSLSLQALLVVRLSDDRVVLGLAVALVVCLSAGSVVRRALVRLVVCLSGDRGVLGPVVW